MIDVVPSWEVDSSADRWQWGYGFLNLRGFEQDSFIYYSPHTDHLKKQIESLVQWTTGSRNWIICISESTIYMRKLFDYVLASYVFTTGKRAIAVDVDDLTEAINDPEGDKRDIIEYADLLLINYCDPANPELKWKKGAIANILHRRKYRGHATVFNMFVRSIPAKIDAKKALGISAGIVDIFGYTAFELFSDDNSKRVVITGDQNGREGSK